VRCGDILSRIAQENESIRPLRRAHAHNDYLHDRPLSSLARGFLQASRRHLVEPDGLLIGHERKDCRSAARWKISISIRCAAVQRQTAGRFSERPAVLSADRREDRGGYDLCRLDKVLARYADILSVIRDGKLETRGVMSFISGNRATDIVAKQAVRYVSIDGRPEDLKIIRPAVSSRGSAPISSLLFTWQDDGSLAVAIE